MEVSGLFSLHNWVIIIVCVVHSEHVHIQQGFYYILASFQPCFHSLIKQYIIGTYIIIILL